MLHYPLLPVSRIAVLLHDEIRGKTDERPSSYWHETPRPSVLIPVLDDFYIRRGKRLFDLFAAIPLFLVSLPLLLVTFIVVVVALGRPVLFIQTRPGRHGRPFRMVKFRTMTETPEGNDHLLSDDERMTTIGRMLRSTSIDELPELWNVIRGEMSLVGPRPLLMEYLPLYTAEQFRRHDVSPGITGLAQVTGRNSLSFEERFELDVYYVDHLSFRLDLRILLYTLLAVISRRGVSQQGRATMELFRGSGTEQSTDS